MISENAIKEFQAIYKDEYGKEISRKKAIEAGTNLLNLMQLICKPPPSKSNQKIIKKVSHGTQRNRHK